MSGLSGKQMLDQVQALGYWKNCSGVLREYFECEERSAQLKAQWEQVKSKFKDSTSHLEGRDDEEFREMLETVHGGLDKQLQWDQNRIALASAKLRQLHKRLQNSGTEAESSESAAKRRRLDLSPASSLSPPLSDAGLPSPDRTSPAGISSPANASTSLGPDAGPSSSTADGTSGTQGGAGLNPGKGKGKGWRKGLTSQAPAPILSVERRETATTTANTLSVRGGYMDPAKARREQLEGQLPLKPGRRVAFRQPLQKKGGVAAPIPVPEKVAVPGTGSSPEEEGETWILATILECINNDRNRYVVQDAEEPDGAGPAPTFNTTLKAIVPLPERVETLPKRDYAVGQKVLALYPDTSCFYKATVKGGGPQMQKVPPSKMAKREHELLNAKYQLAFEDDDDDIKLVPAQLVVERPRF